MTKAFVFGKFLPFHKGHEALIRFALDQCDLLTVLVCCSDQETIPDTIRCAWIKETFTHEPKIEVRVLNYLESELPNTSESSEAVSKVWAKQFKALFPDYSLVITSESYGDYVAQFMQIRHIAFDKKRSVLPVSATDIRNDRFANWMYLPDSVKPYFAIKVVVLGTESTGKSILVKRLAEHFQCSFVSEAGRDLIADSTDFRFEDLSAVAHEHARSIRRAVLGNSPLIIIDTNIYTTISYAQYSFGRQLEVDAEICQVNQAHLYLYLCADAPYVQDGTRLGEAERNALDVSHRQVLAQNKIALVGVNGGWQERFDRAVASVSQLVSAKI